MSVCDNCGKPTIYGDTLLDNSVIGIRDKGFYSKRAFNFCSDRCLKEKFNELDKYDKLESVDKEKQ